MLQLAKESDSSEKWLSVELVIQSPLLPQEGDTLLAKALLDIHTIFHVGHTEREREKEGEGGREGGVT